MKSKTAGRAHKKTNYILIAAASLVLVSMMLLNIHVMYELAAKQSQEIGSMRMENIVNNLQQTLTRAENALVRVGANLETLLKQDVSADDIRGFLQQQKDIEAEISEGDCINVFCTVSNEMYISGMEPPEGYVLQDRNWYKGLMAQRTGEIYISQVYQDAFTDGMCFTVAKVLPDGQTIIGLDYSISQIQASVEAMSEDDYGDALIADKDGTIVGYGDPSLIGEKISSNLPEYQSVFTKAVTGGGTETVFSMTSQEGRNTVFCNRTENGWYLMLRVSNWSLYRESYIQFVRNIVVTVLAAGVFLALYLYGNRQRMRAEQALAEKEEFFLTLPKPVQTASQNADGGKEKDARAAKGRKWTAVTERERRWFEIGIISVLILTMLLTTFVTTYMTFRWSRSRMEEEARGYNYEVSAWILEQKSILDMFSYTVAANPQMLDDYPEMVGFLDRITKHYQGISATYIANPDFPHGHPMVMNNGWVPEEDYVEEERPWYTGAMEAEDFGITEPYYDARTGKYCITFSKKVETDSGEFLGVFAIDFYLDVLMDILGDGYSGTGYAFLVDKDGRVINHPNPEYQFTENNTTNIHDMVYDKVYNSSDIEILWDYDKKLKACISMEESLSNFKVIVVNDCWMIYGDVVRYVLLFLVLFGVCIGAVVTLMNKMMRWQHETDEQLKEAANAARSADQAKSLFLAQMSHEIRTPINAVLGMNEMILRENEDANIQEYALQIQSAGSTLLELINGILDFSKIESGKMEIHPVEYETGVMIQSLVDMVADRARAKHLEVNLQIDNTLPEVLFGDDVRVRQIITNLLTNAVKYTNEGSVTLRIDGELREPDEILLKVEVRDTGIGIRQEDMERLFSSFQRLDEEKNRNIEGTGLGIPIVQNLLHMMGSDLKVESEYGRGSVFSFELLQKVVTRERAGGRQAVRDPAGGDSAQRYVYAPDARILIVDDNKVNLQVARNLLKRNGVLVDTALSGMECIECVQQNSYDLIFMDHMMPQMDGIETFRKLKEEQLLPENTPVVMMTANEIAGAREEYLSLGFTDYISKPIAVLSLEEQLARHLPAELVSYREVRKSEGNGKPEAQKQKMGPAPEPQKSAAEQTAPQRQTEIETAQAASEPQREVQQEPSGQELSGQEPQNTDGGGIPGVDFATGLMYCAESWDFYLEMLEAYVSENTAEELGRLFADGDWDNYRIQVHALKSSSRTVGALQLSDDAKAIEMAVREGDLEFAQAHHEELMEAYRDLLKQIRVYLDGSGEKPEKSG